MSVGSTSGAFLCQAFSKEENLGVFFESWLVSLRKRQASLEFWGGSAALVGKDVGFKD